MFLTTSMVLFGMMASITTGAATAGCFCRKMRRDVKSYANVLQMQRQQAEDEYKRCLVKEKERFQSMLMDAAGNTAKADSEVMRLREECEKWKNAAEQAEQKGRNNAITEMQNLLAYNGTEEGQNEFER